jgi:hypothetical protein
MLNINIGLFNKGHAQMKTRRIALFILIALSVLMLTDAHASSIRCGVRLITEGDHKAKVLAQCGKPDYIELREEERVYRFSRHPSYYGYYDSYEYEQGYYGNGGPYRIRELVIIEEWTYNHGPSRFMDHLILENGVVVDITSGDYGY